MLSAQFFHNSKCLLVYLIPSSYSQFHNIVILCSVITELHKTVLVLVRKNVYFFLVMFIGILVIFTASRKTYVGLDAATEHINLIPVRIGHFIFQSNLFLVLQSSYNSPICCSLPNNKRGAIPQNKFELNLPPAYFSYSETSTHIILSNANIRKRNKVVCLLDDKCKKKASALYAFETRMNDSSF